jgi:hypothetical protein
MAGWQLNIFCACRAPIADQSSIFLGAAKHLFFSPDNKQF